MLARSQQLKLSAEEFAVIEAALQTQIKIFNVQASAGNREAGARLNAVKRTLAGLVQQKPVDRSARRAGGWRWFCFLRSCS